MADGINIRIGLEGDAEIKKKLDNINDHGKKFGQDISKSLNQAVGTNPALGKAFGAEEGVERGRVAAERLREVIHTLHPILDSAGLGLGNLGAFARVAGAGMGFLGAAIVGSVLVGLAKIGDEADKAKRRLDLLTSAGKGGGPSQAEHLNEAAKQLGVLPSDIAPAAETLFKYRQNITAQDRNVIHPPGFVAGPNQEAASQVQIFRPGQSSPGGAPTGETIITALKAAVEAGRIDRSTPKEASAAFNDFFEASSKGKGLVTVQALDQLQKASPSIANAVAQGASGTGVGGTGQTFADFAAFRKFIAQGGQQTGGAALAGLARVEPQIRDQAAKVPVNLTEALGRVEAKSHGLAEELGNATIRAAKFLNQTPAEAYKSSGLEAAANAPGAVSQQQKPFVQETNRGSAISTALKPEEVPNPVLAAPVVAAPAAPAPTTTVIPAAAAQTPVITPALPSEPVATGDPQYDEAVRRGRLAKKTGTPDETPLFTPLAHPKTPSIGPRSEAAVGPLSEAAGVAHPPQQVADLSSVLQSVVSGLADIARNKDTNIANPAAIGVRGDLAPPNAGVPPSAAPPGGASQEVASLAPAANTAQAALSSLTQAVAADVQRLDANQTPAASQPPIAHAAEGGSIVRMADGGEARLNVSPGGHLSGPGTGKSDSIKADVANGEFVVNAEDTARNLPLLHDVNSGKVRDGQYVGGGRVSSPSDGKHFAAGGQINAPDHLSQGPHQITYDPVTGGAYIDGALHLPGDPLLNDPIVKQEIEASIAGANQKQTPEKHKSQFIGDYGESALFADGGLVGHFAEGGVVGSPPIARLQHVISRFASGGKVSIPHFDLGLPDLQSPAIDASSALNASSSNGNAAAAGHHTVDLRTDHGDFRMMSPEETVGKLNRAAQAAKRYSTGQKPSWYGGGG